MLCKKKDKFSKTEICDALWNECPANLNNNLHTSIYKMKKTLLSAGIKMEVRFFNGCYYFNLPEIDCDAYLFSNLFNRIFFTFKRN